MAVLAVMTLVSVPVLAQRRPVEKPVQKNAKAANAKTRQQLEAASWVKIATRAVPGPVMASKQRAFPKARVVKAEQAGTGESAFFRLSFAGGAVRQVTFAADGTVK